MSEDHDLQHDARRDPNWDDFWGGQPAWPSSGEHRRIDLDADRHDDTSSGRTIEVHPRRDTARHRAATHHTIEHQTVEHHTIEHHTIEWDTAPGLGTRLRRWWSGLAGATTASRTHGVAASDDLDELDHFDDLDDLDELDHFDDGELEVVWETDSRPVANRIDPLLARIGVLAIVTTLAVPVILGMRSDDDATLVGESPAAVAATSTPTTSTGPGSGSPTGSESSTGPESPATPPSEAEVGAAPHAAGTSVVADDTVDATDDAASPSDPDAVTATASSRRSAVTVATDAGAESVVDDPAAADEPADRVEPVCALEYEVAAGDYWLRLAEAAGVPIDELLTVNLATSGTPLYPGTTICLPDGASTPAPPTTAAPTTAPPSTATPTTAPAATAAPTTTPPTTASPTTVAPSPPPADLGPDDVRQIIRDVWPDDLEERALEIARRESNFVPTADNNWCCYGVFQIYYEVHRSWLADLGVDSADDLFDPRLNAQAALVLYERAGGWGPWGF